MGFLELNWKLYHKKKKFRFIVAKYTASSFTAPTICLALLTITLGFLELYIAKKAFFAFMLLKDAAIRLYSIKSIFWFVCRKIALLLALLHLKKGFCQFATSHADFYFISLIFVCFRLSSAVFSIMFLRTGFSVSSYVNCALDPLSYGKHVLSCWQ